MVQPRDQYLSIRGIVFNREREGEVSTGRRIEVQRGIEWKERGDSLATRRKEKAKKIEGE